MANGGSILTSDLASPYKHKTKSLINEKDHYGLPYFSISFKYYVQRDFFGIGEQRSTWFAGLFDRLKDFSGKTASILEDYQQRKAYRLHPISLDTKNCPLSADRLKSIYKDSQKLVENDLIWQFQLSKGTGRVIGFFNETLTVFYVILLDPKHNAQPSADYGYTVEDTEIALTDYEVLKLKFAEIEEASQKCNKQDFCPIIQHISQEHLSSNLCYVAIDNELKEKYRDIIEKGKLQPLIETFVFDVWSKD